MRYSIIVLVCIAFITGCIGSGEKVVVKETYESGKPKIVWTFENGSDASEGIERREAGNLMAITKPVNLKHENFYENGNLAAEGNFKKGLANGKWKFYYEDGSLQASCYYSLGNYTDTTLCYFNSGELKRSLIEIDKEKQTWHVIDYYKNGDKASEAYMFMNALGFSVLEGPLKEWYKNGQLKREVTLKNNKSVGEWSTWDEDGNLIETSTEELEF